MGNTTHVIFKKNYCVSSIPYKALSCGMQILLLIAAVSLNSLPITGGE